ncbi:copper transporter [Corynebacterium sp. Q4381]|uniref:copper transporter n=1 Tax=Corynebacterium sp. Marseille-Q4381 TaxID=3121597 RepID=UPI002FE53D5E
MGQGARSSGLVAAGLGWGVAAGVALGALLVAPAMDDVSGGRPATTPAQSSKADAAESNAFADDQVADANDLLASEGDAMVDGVLDGVAVTIIRTASATDEDAAAVRWKANAAGASNSGGVRLTEKFTDMSAVDELATIITSTLPAGTQLSEDNRAPGTHAGESLAAALTTASADDRALVLEALEQAGFVELRGQIVPADVIVLVAADELDLSAEPTGDGEAFTAKVLSDFTAALGSGAPTVATGQGSLPQLGEARTVSFADTEAGRIRTVLQAGELADVPSEHDA